MKVFRVVRLSAIGLMTTGLFSAIAGCSAEDQLRALILFILLLLTGSGADSTPDPMPMDSIVMYSVAAPNGDLNGRAGADLLCQTTPPANLPAAYTNFRAFLSVDNTTPDTISDMPNNYGVPTTVPVVGPPPANVPIGNDWNDLIDGNGILNTLEDANVMTSGNQWTGSTPTGGLDATHCSNWTDGGFGNSGEVGARFTTSGTSWISLIDDRCDTATHRLLCVAYSVKEASELLSGSSFVHTAFFGVL